MYARKPHYAVSFFRYADTKGRPYDTVTMTVKPILYLYTYVYHFDSLPTVLCTNKLQCSEQRVQYAI